MHYEKLILSSKLISKSYIQLHRWFTKGSGCRKKKIEIFVDLNRTGHDKSVKKNLAF